MADLKWMKFWVGNYKADTTHLSPTEHGIYLLMLMHAWDTPGCSLPHDREWLRKRLRITSEEYDRFVVPIISEFWTIEGDRIYQKRQRREWENAVLTSEKRKVASETRWGTQKIISLKR